MLLSSQNVAKPWGKVELPHPFQSSSSTPIGEIWFEPPSAFSDILVKYIFTSEKLSVQVHPSDLNPLTKGIGRKGKDECWLITSADPNASLAIGFKEKLGVAEVRSAALDGSIEDLLAWYPVTAGDFFYIPAGTVHAIGEGISLIEVQQNTDITYRLYDYGRPRELHLEEAMAVAKLGLYDPLNRKRLEPQGCQTLVEGPHFELRYVDSSARTEAFTVKRQPALILPLEGTISIGEESVLPGQCALLDGEELVFGEDTRFLLIHALPYTT